MIKFSINAFVIDYAFLNQLDMQEDLLPVFVLAKAAGADAIEMGAASVEQVDTLARHHEQTKLESLVEVAGPVLYTEAWEAEVEKAVAIAAAFKDRLGTPMVNICPFWKPDPEREHHRLEKTDEELERQAKAYGLLLNEIERLGMKACYHTHDAELVNNWRELRHLAGSCPGMKFCLDAHWVYAGSDFRDDALTDFVTAYGKDIVHVHARQCKDHEMQAVFTPNGDIDYPDLFRALKNCGYSGNYSLEQFYYDQPLNEPEPYAAILARSMKKLIMTVNALES
jgi:inosose dehydratase